jgi:hypothetical protein
MLLVEEYKKKHHIQIITNSLAGIWRSHNDVAKNSSLPGRETVSAGINSYPRFKEMRFLRNVYRLFINQQGKLTL